MSIDITKPNRSQTIGDAIDSTRANLVDAANADAAHQADMSAHGLGAIGANVADYLAHKTDTEAHGLTAVKARITSTEAELSGARGSQLSVAARLANALTASGALLLSNLANKWITPGDVPTYVDSTHFTVPGDRRLVFIAGANLRLTVSAAYVYAPVASSSLAAGVTTITLDPSYPVLTAGLSALDLALIAFDNTLANSIATEHATLLLQASQIGALQVLEVADFVNGVPSASLVLTRYAAVRPFTIPINAVGSQFKGTVNATASTTFNLQKNGVTFGTVLVGAGSSTGVYTVATATAFVAGDLLTVVAPASPDATFAHPSFNLKGTLT